MCISACRGLSPQRANELILLELGRTKSFLEAEKEAEEVIFGYGGLVVGLTHSRGVGRVTPVEPNPRHLKGLAV